eukprot:scaffold1135_cov216-Pinguiococcus_pyrenoidosus.AAC.7
MMARPRQARKFRTMFPRNVYFHKSEDDVRVRDPHAQDSFEFVSAGKIVFGPGTSPYLLNQRRLPAWSLVEV